MKASTVIILCIASGIAGAGSYPVVAPVVVPHYAAAHIPGDQQAASGSAFTDEDRSRLKRVEDMLTELLRMIKEEEPEQPTEPTTPPAPPSEASRSKLIGSAATVCASCHHANTANDKGGGFQMFNRDGTFATFRDADRKRIVDKVTSGEMPKNGKPRPLTEAEKEAFLSLFRPQPAGQPK